MKSIVKIICLLTLLCSTSCGDSNPPQLIIESPIDGDAFTAGDTLTLLGNVTDDVQVDSLTFFSEGLLSGSLNINTASNLMDIDFFTEFIIDSTVIRQDYRLEAKAYDNNENETIVTVDFSVR